MPPSPAHLADFLEMAKKKRWSELEAPWLETVSDPVTDLAFFRDLAKLLVNYHEEARLEEMTQTTVMALNDEGRHLVASRILRLVLRTMPEGPELHVPLLRALRGAYAQRPNLEKYIEASGLTEPAGLGASLRRFEQMLWSSEGAVFRHKSWGVGIVAAQDLERGEVTIDFPDRRGQVFKDAGLREFLEKIPGAHAVAQVASDPEGVRERAKSDPVALVKHTLVSHGRAMKQSEIKAVFVPAVFTAAQWSRWWTATRDKMLSDPMMDVGAGGAHSVVALRKTPKSALDEVMGRLDIAKTAAHRHQAVRTAARFLKSGALAAAEATAVSERLRAGHEEAEELADRLTWALLGEELARAAEGNTLWRPDTATLLTEADDEADLLRALPITDHRQRTLELIFARDAARFGELCLAVIDESPLPLIKWMMRQMLDADALRQAAEDALAQLLHDPDTHPDAYLWALGQVLGGPLAHLSATNDAPHLLARTLDYLEDIEQQIAHEAPNLAKLRALAARLRHALEEDHHALVVHTFEELTPDAARTLHQHMMRLTALSDAWKEAVTVSIGRVRSDLRAPADAEEEIHFVTDARLREKRAELQHLHSVEIPQNSKDIQTAREHGDLSENAEYKAAKERQVILHRRAEELDRLLATAQPIVPEAITGETVVPGARITVRRVGDEAEEKYALLGMWDADPASGVIFHRSPFAAPFMRRRVGEQVTVDLPSGETHDYEIMAIENALA